ncbi:hypothetical protein [Herbidospora sp. NBRC 101105]|uniref:hypothetical protein n=1 Tax=Herbidospora sp. NBRC 101105 TaxID=3032195 RepID=UPI0024A24F28|nr:hypothetical protein [Herbidospora sp. NBRC 101105]GLX95880.1 hypothetical protein Hesp01_38300 [Herbidospora sp. NBRC 101105]
MNPNVAGAPAKADQSATENYLILLAGQLTEIAIRAELREENRMVLVYPPNGPGLPVAVFIGYGGTCFSWNNAEKRHPVADIKGAADALKEYVTR